MDRHPPPVRRRAAWLALPLGALAVAIMCLRARPPTAPAPAPETTQPADEDERDRADPAPHPPPTPEAPPSRAVPAFVRGDAAVGSDGGTAVDAPAAPPDDAGDLHAIVRDALDQVAAARARARDAGMSADTVAMVTSLAASSAVTTALDRVAEGAGPAWEAQLEQYLQARQRLQVDGGGAPGAALDALRHQIFTGADVERAAAVEQLMNARAE